ncbi:MAG: amidohydrolase [Betaproteobacteria bacterium]|nr:amidohydrolase [Betaproteobacteria bacterium]
MRVITLEEHFASPLQIEKTKHQPKAVFKERSAHVGHDIEAELYDIGERRIAAMDAAGIDMQVLSLTQPACETFDADVAIPMAREANDLMYDAVKAHPTRFAAFAALPTPDPEAAVKELERAIMSLGFRGAMINGHTRGSFMDDRKYWGIFECAQSHDLPIYLHPATPHTGLMQAYFQGYEDIARAAWGFAIDASIHFLRILFSGAFDQFPRLRIILGHMGEGLPFGMHRLGDHTGYVAKRRGLKRHPLEYMRENLVITTAGACSVPALLCSMLEVGADNILFSVDWPYESSKVGTAFLRSLPISEQDREKIAHGNAERILRL